MIREVFWNSEWVAPDIPRADGGALRTLLLLLDAESDLSLPLRQLARFSVVFVRRNPQPVADISFPKREAGPAVSGAIKAKPF